MTTIDSTIIVGALTATAAVIGSWITGRVNWSEALHALDMKLAVIAEQIKTLSDRVEDHNKFAQRIPQLEQKIADMNDRLERLEDKVS